ncbi:uncharacterized protein [Eurosta solidaginis]|uniref:uncharacterized protein n=1 Tax=Eurosta solidaginis TaxID=178769 RepID=UPI0035314B93
MYFIAIPLTLFTVLLCSKCVHTTDSYSARKHRQARTLIYPPTSPTRLQYIAGIGIPVEDLTYESVTSGYVLKAEYFLPTKAEEMRPQYLKPQPIARRSFENYNYTVAHTHNTKSEQQTMSNDMHSATNFDTNWSSKQKTAASYRWIIYKSMEILMDRKGLSGRSCMLRSICEHAVVPLHYESGILAEILHIILTPSQSHDEIDHPSNKDYGRAERIGRNGRDCAATYTACANSPLDLITAIFELEGQLD